MTFSPLEKLDSSPSFSRRPLLVTSFFMLAVLGIASARLFELTVIHGQENRDRADQNRILVRSIPASRGVILDRNGIPLTRNVPSIREVDFPGDDLGPVPIETAVRSYPFGPALAHVVGYVGEVSQQELDECQFQKTQNTRRAGDSENQKIGESDSDLSGVSDNLNFWSSEFSEFSESEKKCSLNPGDVVGKSGLEKQYDSLLRGVDGAELIEVDANGKTLRTISTQAPISGQNLAVNLDANLSVAAYTSLSGKKGAVVAIDPKDGAVLALVSSPSFDPANIAASLADTENLPLFNRAAGGEYPPGSIFKLVTASAGLSKNKISASTLIEDTGEIRVGDFRYGNWYFDQYGRTEGAINIVRAISRSNDIFFYRVGERLGPQTLADWAKRLGLGEASGIDLPSEADGLIPDPVWKERWIGEKWYLGNTYHMAIGQGDVRVTPLQAAVMTNSVITGKLCPPHLIQKTQKTRSPGKSDIPGGSEKSDIRFSDSLIFRLSGSPSFPSVPKINPVYASEQLRCEEVGLSDETRNLVLEGMVGSCSPGGVAFPFFEWNQNRLPPSVPDGASGDAFPAVGCKTGTAQHGGAKTLPHAWIAVAAPINGPAAEGPTPLSGVGPYDLDLESPKRIVLVVLVEESGEGSYVAAPVAKQILTEWFK